MVKEERPETLWMMVPFESEPPLVPAPLLSTAEPSRTPVLFGPLGLRAGWGIALYLLIGLVLTVALGYGLVMVTGLKGPMHQAQVAAHDTAMQARKTHAPAAPQPMRLAFQMVNEVTTTAAFLLTALGIGFLERRRFGVYGLRLRYLRDILPGAFWGLVAMGLLVGSLRGLHLLVFDKRLLGGAAAVRSGAGWLLLFLFVGISEEFLFRGYLQFTQMRGLLALARKWAPAHERVVAFWMSAVIWSLVFLGAHISNSGENAAGLLGVFTAGILFSYALWRTGSLWWGIGLHMTWDWSQSFLYGVPDSGTLSIGRLFQTHAVGNPLLSGSVDGPEGSLLVIPVFLLLFLAVRLQPQGTQPPLEPEPPVARLQPAEGQPA